VVRVIAVFRVAVHEDEPASLLAAMAVRHRGWPVLPSGVPYLQGATVSYLVAPIANLGDSITPARLLLAVSSVVSLLLTYRLARELTSSRWLPLVATALVAFDPPIIEWTVRARMYGVLQAASLLFVLLAIRGFRPGSRDGRALVMLGLVAWFGIFTDVLFALVLVPVGGLLLLSCRWVARRDWLPRIALLLGMGAAPVALFALNRRLGSSQQAAGTGAQGLFVGEHLFSLRRVLQPDPRSWEALFGPGALGAVLPYILVGLSAVLADRWLRRRRNAGGGGGGAEAPPGGWLRLTRPGQPPPPARSAQRSLEARATDRRSSRQFATWVVLACYWLPMLLVSCFAAEPAPRYVVALQPLGYVIAAVAVHDLAQHRQAAGPRVRAWWRRVPAISAVALILIGVNEMSGLTRRANGFATSPDIYATARYVAARHRRGEPVLVGLPPPMALALGEHDDVVFLAGARRSPRASRYTRRAGDGTLIDFWVGAPALVTAGQICSTLLANRDSWVVVDPRRLDTNYLSNEMKEALLGLTTTQYVDNGGLMVRRPTRAIAVLAADPKICPQGGAG